MADAYDAPVEAADRAAREWKASGVDPIPPGSDAHKVAFCRMLLDTHNRYKPAIIDWPTLEPEARDRLVWPSDLGYRGADRGQGATTGAKLCGIDF